MNDVIENQDNDDSVQKSEENNMIMVEDPDCSHLKVIAEGSLVAKLYQIIDDIDTGLDMFHPEMENYEKFVCRKIDEKKNLVVSDGYKLFHANRRKEDDFPRKIKSAHHRDKMVEISTILSDLASQEGCDGEPYDEMMKAAEYITELEEKISIMEETLTKIADPMDYFLTRAEKTMTHIVGRTAIDLSNDAGNLSR